MLKFILKRLLEAIPTLLVLITVSFFMMRFAIVRHGQSGAINDYIGLNLFEEMTNVRFIPYICFNETIFPCIIRKNIRMQRAPRYLILCMNR